MADAKCLIHHPTSSDLGRDPVNEETPLLPQVLDDDDVCCTTRQATSDSGEWEDENSIDIKTAAWTMASIWLGTFCAGLGKDLDGC